MPVAVLSHDSWSRRFGRDASVVNEVVVVNGQTLTVVGVAPPEPFSRSWERPRGRSREPWKQKY